ncbi:reverse transcriptase domain-containing protein [Tanacetum coccineum]
MSADLNTSFFVLDLGFYVAKRVRAFDFQGDGLFISCVNEYLHRPIPCKHKIKGRFILGTKFSEGPVVLRSPRSYQEKSFLQNGITWAQGVRFRPKTSRFEAWNEENAVSTSVGIRAEVPVKMPPRRNRPLTEAYEQEFEQRVMARMEERLDQFSENPFFDGDGSSSDEQPDRPRRNQREDNRRWESRMRVNIPEFDGNTLNPEGFIDWLVTIEEVFEFKEVPKNKRVSLIATKLRGRASAWWQQLKLTRERVGKPRVTSWRKMKKLLRENFIPHNYQR